VELFSGFLDEVRVFSFAPGAFSTNDLLLNPGRVRTTADFGATSLRQAITKLNATGTPGAINFAVTGTITLASDLPAISNSVTITGPGANLLSMSGGNSFSLFQLAAKTANDISGLTLANGSATNDSGAALYNPGYMTLENCLLVSNTVVGGFVAVVANFGTGTLLVTNCSFFANTIYGGKTIPSPIIQGALAAAAPAWAGRFTRKAQLSLYRVAPFRTTLPQGAMVVMKH
jgi:hypothetical protein